MHTADDDSVPVPHEALKLPRALLNWETPSQRGVAGRWQSDERDPDRTPVSRRDPLNGARAQPHASTDAFDDDPTTAIPVPFLPLPIQPRAHELPDAPQVLRGRGALQLDAALARAAQLWREHPLRMAAIVAGVALLTYLAVDYVRHRSDGGSQTLLAPVAALPAPAPIIVEQLSEARQPRETGAPLRREQADKPGRRSVGRHARETSFGAVSAGKSSGDPLSAPAHSKSHRAERSSPAVSSSSAGLPAWGAEAVRDFSGGESSKAATATTRSEALSAKPVSSNADIPAAMAADPPSAREEPKPAPVVAAKPAEPPPEPVAPPAPRKPLTMDQMLNQVEEAAQAQRKKAGLKAPKTSQRDAELDELINGAMTSKK